MVRTQPVVFSPVDPHMLYFAANTLWKTKDGGRNWEQISPDLTRKTFEVPDTIGKYRSQPTAQPTQRGVIYAVAPSPLDINLIWAGTDDGLIHRTTDGGATLDRCHADAAEALAEDFDHRCQPFRYEHRLRGGQYVEA